MTNICFIGDANSFLIIQLVKWIRKNQDFSVTIIHTLNTKIRNPDMFSGSFASPMSGFLYRFPFLGRYLRTKNINRLIDNLTQHYEVAHIHGAKRIYSGIMDRLENKADKIILTFWGSDFNRVSHHVRQQLLPVLQRANLITFANDRLRDQVIKYYKNIDPGCTRIVKFGLESLDLIESTQKDREGLKEYFHLPFHRVVITVGYNSSPNQQHIKILESLRDNRALVTRSHEFVLVFPLTYGGSDSYIKKLKAVLKDLPFSYSVIMNRLSDEEVAWLRMVSDIMIQLQRHDQFSGSMQEYLFAGNVVITGDWLPYDEMKKKGIVLKKVSEIDEIGETLVEVLDHFEEKKKRFSENKEKIYALSSWPNNINQWLSLYTEP